MDQSQQSPLCKECGEPNVWALLGNKRYSRLCGPCRHKMEDVLAVFRQKYGDIEGVDENAIDLFS